MQLEHLFNCISQSFNFSRTPYQCAACHTNLSPQRLFIMQSNEFPAINDDVFFHSFAAVLSGEG
jgi:hypothetical protein